MNYFSITLKLHNPGQEKRRILKESIKNYTDAFNFLMDSARGHISDIENNCGDSVLNLSKWVDKDLSAKLNQFNAEPFKDSIKLDFGMTLAGYLRLKKAGRNPGFPNSLQKQRGKSIRPVFFCRYDTKRNYCLLYDAVKDRYYVKLYLLNRRMSLTNKKIISESRLIYVDGSGRKLESKGRNERFLIFPLSFGKWQKKYLDEGLKNPKIFKTARLTERNGDYFITLSIKLPEKEEAVTDTYMGISRGFEKPVCYTIIDRFGKKRESGAFDVNKAHGEKHELGIQDIYRIANQIAEKALKHSSQVIMESMPASRERIKEKSTGDKNGGLILSRPLYAKMARIASYKLEHNGLPKPVKVSSSDIFTACPECGFSTVKNIASKEMFLCISCGMAAKIDDLGSLNLASKLIKYSNDGIVVKVVKHPNEVVFSNELLGLNMRLPGMDGCMEKLRKEIERIVQEIKESQNNTFGRKDLKRKWSMVCKIEEYDDFMKHIKFI